LTEKDLSPLCRKTGEELLDPINEADKEIYAPPGLDPVPIACYDGAAGNGACCARSRRRILYVKLQCKWPGSFQMEKGLLDASLPLGEYTYN